MRKNPEPSRTLTWPGKQEGGKLPCRIWRLSVVASLAALRKTGCLVYFEIRFDEIECQWKRKNAEGQQMQRVEKETGFDSALKAAMEEACARIAKGIYPTVDQRRTAAARVDRMREENAKLFGVQNVTLDAVRASRSS